MLSTPAAPITTFNRHTEALIRDLMDTVDAPGRAGVAAPQIGVGLRAFSYRVDGQIGYVINPEIVELSEEIQEDGNEGCLSVPGLWYPTPRARRAVVKGVDLRNEPVVVAGTGVMARCLQHETDHLAGALPGPAASRDAPCRYAGDPPFPVVPGRSGDAAVHPPFRLLLAESSDLYLSSD